MLCAICMIALSAAMIGCGSSYGNIQRSREVGRLFENTEILPDHNYYYSGPDAIPYALIGIDKKYTLESRYWKRINLTEEQLRSAFLEPCPDIGRRVAEVIEEIGREARVCVIPQGPQTIPYVREGVVRR